jgi:SAM-dependent methyltransferase
VSLTHDDVSRIFSAYLSRVPVALAVREVTRMIAVSRLLADRQLDADAPQGPGLRLLDVGCGDGSFWEFFPRRAELVLDGVDLSTDEIRLARASGLYREVWAQDVSSAPFPSDTYDLTLGNCSLEHVPRIHESLLNIWRALKPGGLLILCVPAFGWTKSFRSVQFLERFSVRLAMAMSGAIDGFFQHHHLYDERTWCYLVQMAGFVDIRSQGLGGQAINWAFESHLPVSYLEFAYKSVFRRYPPQGGWRHLVASEAIAELHAQPIASNSPQVVEYAITARKPAVGRSD